MSTESAQICQGQINNLFNILLQDLVSKFSIESEFICHDTHSCMSFLLLRALAQALLA